MNRIMNVADQILAAVSDAPGCRLDDVVRACPDFTWNQVFLEVDRLSRQGALLLKMEGPGVYSVRLPDVCTPQRFGTTPGAPATH
jgi:hypothetical protein